MCYGFTLRRREVVELLRGVIWIDLSVACNVDVIRHAIQVYSRGFVLSVRPLNGEI